MANNIYQYLLTIFSFVKEWWLCFVFFFCVVIGSLILRNKNVQFELKELFAPLKIASKRSFISFLFLLNFVILLIVNLLYTDEIFNRESIYAFLGLIFTSFYGVIIILKTSINNIGRLLSRISYMMEGDPKKELFIILPTPFLGYLDYKKNYNKIDYYLNNAPKYHLAILDWEPSKGNKITIKLIEEKLTSEYNKLKKSFDNTSFVHKLSEKKSEEKAKERSWYEFVKWSKNGNRLPDLFQFHLDEIQLVNKVTDSAKYDYFIKTCEFINALVKRSNNNKAIELRKIAISYNFTETVFPIILINMAENKILHGTTRVESQLKVRFEGDAIIDNNLCKNAGTMFNAYIVY